MSTSGDLIVGPRVNGHLSKDERQKDREKMGGGEKKKLEMEKEKDRERDKSKGKKGVLKGLGDMFRYVTTLLCCLKHWCPPALCNSIQLIHQLIIQNTNAALIRERSPWTLWGGGADRGDGGGRRPQGPLALLKQIIFNKNSMFYSWCHAPPFKTPAAFVRQSTMRRTPVDANVMNPYEHINKRWEANGLLKPLRFHAFLLYILLIWMVKHRVMRISSFETNALIRSHLCSMC